MLLSRAFRLLSIAGLMLPPLASQVHAAPPVGFEERFALAPDRAAALKELVAGSPEFYYYAALHAQNSDDAAATNKLLTEWATRYPEADERQDLLTSRQRFLDYATNPQATLKWLRETHGLNFDHSREVAGTDPDLPNSVDPALVNWEAFFALAVSQDPNLGTLTDSGVRALFHRGLAAELAPEARRALLGRLNRPDLPGLVEFILADLSTKTSRGFGEFPIHSNLLLDQLQALVAARPALMENRQFVDTWLARLAPPDGSDPDRDPAVRLAWLERLEAFANQLPATFNSVKAAILHARLVFDLKLGRPDAARFLSYLKLPRPVPYLNPVFRNNPELFRHAADLSLDLMPLIGGGPIQDDSGLVRQMLLLLLAKNPDIKPYQPWLEAAFLDALLAEAQLTAAAGSPEDFISLLPPAALQQLRTRTDLEFDAACRETWLPADEVSLDLHIKNVPQLLVKVFEINTGNVHRNSKRQVNTDLDLDGLVANREYKFDYTTPPLQRVRRSFKFPELNGKRGVWIIEFIGGGKASRALVRKGNLTILPTPTGAGTRLTVLDEQARPVAAASALLGSQRFDADEAGHILLPFTTTAGEQQVIVDDGLGFTTLENVNLLAENYSLSAGIHVPMESLLPGQKAVALLRPVVLANGQPTTLQALNKGQLTMTAMTLEGIPSTTIFPLKDLQADQETTVTFQVPARLASLHFMLSGEVDSLVTGKPVEVRAQHAINLNNTSFSYIGDLHFVRGTDGWSLDYLGRNGEPLANQQLNLTFTHRDFTNSISHEVRTEANGKASLGQLPGIASLSAATPPGLQRTYSLPKDDSVLPAMITALAGEPIRISWPWPAPDAAVKPAGGEAQPTLLEVRRSQFVRQVREGISIKDGVLEITNPGLGTWSLFCPEKHVAISIRIIGGKPVEEHLVSPSEALDHHMPPALAVTSLTPGKATVPDAPAPVDILTVQLANIDASTRVHLTVSRFVPEFHILPELSAGMTPAPAQIPLPFRPSLYQSARAIGDEYRYVLDRQGLTPFAGNLLPHPGLLLNPWAIAETSTEKQEAAVGEAAGAMDVDRKLSLQTAQRTPAEEALVKLKEKNVTASVMPPLPDLAFLAAPGAVAFNLRPGADGKVNFPAALVRDGQLLRVTAISNDVAVTRDFPLSGKPLQSRDLRLSKGLDPATPFAQQHAVTVLEEDAPLTIPDAAGARYQAYTDLPEVWDLLYNISKNPVMMEFSFLRTWASLEEPAKRTLYAKFACHELNFFLSRKDPDFFNKVIQPFLANKRDHTFFDEFLLAKNLERWLALPSWQKLNTAERILLARRLQAGQPAAAARELSDFLATQPRDAQKDLFLFESALGSHVLEGSNSSMLGTGVGQNMDHFYEFSPADSSTGRGMLPAPAAAALSDGAAPDVVLDAVPNQPAAPALAAKENKVIMGRRRLQENEFQLRQEVRGRVLYRQTELTREWAENNYYKLPIAEQHADLIRPNRFWQDYALWDGQQPFLSNYLTEAAENFSGIMLALAVLDLPLESGKNPVAAVHKDGATQLTASGRALIFHQEIKPAEIDQANPALMISQNFYDSNDRYDESGEDKKDKFVTREFLTGTVYGCQIVVTNPTSSHQRLDVLFQIPAGSLPIQKTRPTQSVSIALNPFHTQTLDFQFYFPAAGEFAHYPVHVSRAGKVAGKAAPVKLKVVDTLTEADVESWAWISQHAKAEEVLAWLEKANLHQTNLERIAWRLEDRPFYDKLIALLRSRKHYQDTVFSYAVLHNDLPALRDFLSLRNPLPNEPLDSPILTVDPVEQRTFQWLEYSPLVNARAHQLGGSRMILNNKFRRQYDAFLRLLSFRAEFSPEQQLGLTAVLLLQDRITEAAEAFAKVDRARVHEQLQYDYLQAWLALGRSDLATARRIAGERGGEPLPDHWAGKFRELTAQLNEIDGKDPGVADKTDRDARQDRMAAAEPQFGVKVEGKAVTVDYRNVAEVVINYYPMDLEFLFSANPFVGQDTSQFRSIQPHQTEKLTLPADKFAWSFPLPAKWQNSNVLIEVTAAGQSQAVASYANQLDVQISENYGLLQVRHDADQRPMPRAYVKVFAEIAGKPVFYKDGYTDLRGKFDYTSLGTDDLDRTTRFSILILTQDSGAMVREVKPPAR